MNIQGTKAVVSRALKNKLTAILWGKAGIGKSQVVAQIAESFAEENKLKFTDKAKDFDNKHFGFVDLRLGQMETGDLIGMPIPLKEEGKTIFLKPLWFPTEKDSKGIIFLDELNRARLDVIQAVFQLVWDRKLASHILPEGWGIVVACNPAGSEYFVNDLDPALMDRFVHIKVHPETKEWIEWAQNTGDIRTEITDFIGKYPEMLGNDGCDIPIEIKPSPRSWQVLNLMLNNLDEDLWIETATGIIGIETAIPFIENLKKNIDKPIRAVQVLGQYSKWKTKIKSYSNPEKSRLDLLKITCDDIERVLRKDFSSTDKNLTQTQENNLIAYMRDIPKDLMFAMVKTIVDAKKMGTDKFNQILCKYNDIYLHLEKVSELGN